MGSLVDALHFVIWVVGMGAPALIKTPFTVVLRPENIRPLRASSPPLLLRRIIVVVGMILFGYTTVIGWAYYGEKCVEYLFGVKSILCYRLLFSVALCFGAVMELAIVWKLQNNHLTLSI